MKENDMRSKYKRYLPKRLEKHNIEWALRVTKGSQAQAAELLRCTPRGLRKAIKRCGLNLWDFKRARIVPEKYVQKMRRLKAINKGLMTQKALRREVQEAREEVIMTLATRDFKVTEEYLQRARKAAEFINEELKRRQAYGEG